jgi:hypothetical protein
MRKDGRQHVDRWNISDESEKPGEIMLTYYQRS